MERPPRNIVGLLTLFIAALGSVAVIGAEHHRSATNTFILVIAAMAAVGSLLALVLGSVWFGVLKQDARERRDARPGHKWSTRHYAGQEMSIEMRESGVDLIVYLSNENAVRAQGLPCLIVRLDPRTWGDAEARPLKGATVSCAVSRKQGLWPRRAWATQPVEVPTRKPLVSEAVGRWPDEWFDPDLMTPTPGRYRVCWEVRLPDGRIERPREKVRVLAKGEEHVGRLARAVDAARAFIRHYRGREE